MKTKLASGWKMMKISDIATSVAAGGTPSRDKKEYWQNGHINWLKISDMKSIHISKTEEKITKLGLENSSAKLFPRGTVVYSIFATLGSVGILDIESATNQAIAGILPKKEMINTKYLYYCLKSERDKIISKKSHATQDNLNLSILRKHEIPVPPIHLQEKIVSILEKAEKLKEMRKEADELTKEYLKAVFLEMFGDPVTNNKGWVLKKLGKLSSVGSSKRVFVDELVEDGIPFYRGTEIGALSESNNISPKFFIKEEHYLKLKESTGVPAVGDLLLPSICFDGRIWQVDTKMPFYFKDGRVLWIHLEKSDINSTYLQYLLHEIFVRNYNQIASGTTFSELKIFALKNLDIMVPPISVQNKFASIVKEVEVMKEYQKQSREHIENLFNNLMQKAFRGDLAC